MSSASLVLLSAAVSIAFVHTLVGVDHYLPFVLIGKARKWGLKKTLGLTALCGLGHVLGSILLGAVGIGLGVALNQMTWIESIRGSIAAWSLIGFGLVYASWHFIRARRGLEHSHLHRHGDGSMHTHAHLHHGEHRHTEEGVGASSDAPEVNLTGWTLFVIFVFGPCEALIPLLMAPASQFHWGLVLAVTLTFSLVTIATMLFAVSAVSMGFRFVSLKVIEKHANTLAGLAIAMSGLAIQLLGI